MQLPFYDDIIQTWVKNKSLTFTIKNTIEINSIILINSKLELWEFFKKNLREKTKL